MLKNLWNHLVYKIKPLLPFIYWFLLILCFILGVRSNVVLQKEIKKEKQQVESCQKMYKLEKAFLTNAAAEMAKKDKEIKDKNEKYKKLQEEKEKLQKQLKTAQSKAAVASSSSSSKTTTTSASSNTYRLTSYYAGDGTGSGRCTGSGKCIKDFQVNEKGWYTYKGRLVMATATTHLLKNGWKKYPGIKKYYSYGDTFNITIKGTTYPAIVLDSCGACMKKNIVDIFVSGKKSAVGGTVTIS